LDLYPEPALLAKALWSVVIVLVLTFVAERVSTRVAGLLSGAPMTVILVHYFVGSEKGTDFIVESIPHGIAAFTATLAFLLGYHAVSTSNLRFAAVIGALAGCTAFATVAAVLAELAFTIPSALALTLGTVALCTWRFRHISFTRVENPVRYTTRLLFLRGAFTGLLLVGVIGFAQVLGPRWTGLLGGFPATLLPTLLILHLTYGASNTHSVVRNFPIGLGSILLYMVSVPITLPRWGLLAGVLVSLAVSLIYLSAVMLWGERTQAKGS